MKSSNLSNFLKIYCVTANFLNISSYSFFQRIDYVKYAKVFPLSDTLDFKVPSKWYRRVVGSLEIICGLAMSLIPNGRFLMCFFATLHCTD